MNQRTLGLLLVLLVPALASRAAAQSPEECAPTDALEPLRLLRQASLDILHRVPTVEETQAVVDAPDRAAAVDAAIEAMFEQEEYFEQVRRTFQVQLWSGLDAINSLIAAQNRLSYDRTDDLYYIGSARRRYRGNSTVRCLNQLQTEFDASGRPVPIETFSEPACRDVGLGDGVCKREGYVLVRPFWDPSTEIKVCAYDAQAMATGLDGGSCQDYNPGDRGCGCGPNLRRCLRESDSGPIRRALEEEPARIFEHVVRQDLPFVEAFRTRTSFVNGRSAHVYRYMSGANSVTTSGAVVYEPQMPTLPNVPYTDTEWRQVERGPNHAGVLTTLSYLLRFASNRARANRFYTAFLCDPFVPSADGLPAEEENPSPNLRERNGCSDCHNILEPAAAHWGRWRIGGTFGFLDPSVFSLTEPIDACLCGEGTSRRRCSGYCQTYHVTASNSAAETYETYAGLPMVVAYLDETERRAIDIGPLGLTDEPHEEDQVARCAVRTLAQTLLGRELSSSETRWLEEHTEAFEASNMSYTLLFKTLVADEKYRALR